SSTTRIQPSLIGVTFLARRPGDGFSADCADWRRQRGRGSMSLRTSFWDCRNDSLAAGTGEGTGGDENRKQPRSLWVTALRTRRDARPLVPKREETYLREELAAEVEGAAGWGILDRVLEEVEEDDLDLSEVRLDKERLGRELRGKLPAAKERLGALDGGADDVV